MFAEEFEVSTLFCPLIGSDLQPYDANGDGYDDLTCHTSNGIITITESHIVEQRMGRVSVFQGTEDGIDEPEGSSNDIRSKTIRNTNFQLILNIC